VVIPVIQTILPKRRYLSTHFGLKYLSNDGINLDLFYRKKLSKIHTFRPAKKSRANFEWSVPLNVRINAHSKHIILSADGGKLTGATASINICC